MREASHNGGHLGQFIFNFIITNEHMLLMKWSCQILARPSLKFDSQPTQYRTTTADANWQQVRNYWLCHLLWVIFGNQVTMKGATCMCPTVKESRGVPRSSYSSLHQHSGWWSKGRARAARWKNGQHRKNKDERKRRGKAERERSKRRKASEQGAAKRYKTTDIFTSTEHGRCEKWNLPAGSPSACHITTCRELIPRFKKKT